MQRVNVMLRASGHFNAVLRRGELFALKPIKQGEAITVQLPKPDWVCTIVRTDVFKPSNILNPPPLPRSNTF